MAETRAMHVQHNMISGAERQTCRKHGVVRTRREVFDDHQGRMHNSSGAHLDGRSMPGDDWKAPSAKQAKFLGKMVRLDRESSNSLFETLEQWESHLAQLDLTGLERGHDKPKI